MSTVLTSPAPLQSKSNRKPPRPPQSWSYDASCRELTIVDCNGRPGLYHVQADDSDLGVNYLLTNVDDRFGESRTVHLGFAAADDSCDCPGFCYTERCKHHTACRDLAAAGLLPLARKGGAA